MKSSETATTLVNGSGSNTKDTKDTNEAAATDSNVKSNSNTNNKKKKKSQKKNIRYVLQGINFMLLARK